MFLIVIEISEGYRTLCLSGPLMSPHNFIPLDLLLSASILQTFSPTYWSKMVCYLSTNNQHLKVDGLPAHKANDAARNVCIFALEFEEWQGNKRIAYITKKNIKEDIFDIKSLSRDLVNECWQLWENDHEPKILRRLLQVSYGFQYSLMN